MIRPNKNVAKIPIFLNIRLNGIEI